jgi:hypothetical protein
VVNWNTDEQKITEFYLMLRNKAILWWDTLEDNAAINQNSWANIQREFLPAYAPRFTARTTCTNFQDLIQHNGENVHDYYLRVSDAFKKMCEAKLARIATVRVDRGAATAAQAMDIKSEAIKDFKILLQAPNIYCWPQRRHQNENNGGRESNNPRKCCSCKRAQSYS